MSEHEVKGEKKKLEGGAREAIGKVTDDKSEQARGKLEKMEGKVEEGAAKLRHKDDR